MKSKKWKFYTVVIMTLVIFAYVGYAGVSKYSNGYKEISNETKEKITSIIKKSKGEIPNLQTDSSKASWIDEAHNKQKEMMDKVLDNLTVVGESRRGKPDKFIIATFYDNMRIYIPYNEKTPYKKIVIEVDGYYYIGTANEVDVNEIIDYMKKQQMLR
jgi:hypothetical protein